MNTCCCNTNHNMYLYTYVCMSLILVLTYYVSLSTLVLNSRDRHEKYDLLKKMCLENNLTTTFSSTCCHTIYWYDAISTIFIQTAQNVVFSQSKLSILKFLLLNVL